MCSAILASSATACMYIWLELLYRKELTKDGAGHVGPLVTVFSTTNGRKDCFPTTSSPSFDLSPQLYTSMDDLDEQAPFSESFGLERLFPDDQLPLDCAMNTCPLAV